MTSRLKRTTPVMQAPFLDWLPEDFHYPIRSFSNTGPDVSSYLKNAIEECSDTGEELLLTPGVYCLATSCVPTKTCRIRGRNATLKATADLDTFPDGRGSILDFRSLTPRIRNVTFDSSLKRANGLFFFGTSRAQIYDCNFIGIAAGYAGARGASSLYTKFVDCYFNGAGRSIDFQKGWEYGVHMSGNPAVTFTDSGTADTITRSTGSWITDGFTNGDHISVKFSASNNNELVIATVTATVLTLVNTSPLVNEGPVTGVQISVPGGSYYGIHASVARECIFTASEGARVNGMFMFDHTDHEHAVNQPALFNEANLSSLGVPRCAAITCGEEIDHERDTHMYEFNHIYTELQEGTVGRLTAIWDNVGQSATFTGCQILGSSSSVVGSVAIRNFLGSGTGGYGSLLKKWETAFLGSYSGNAGDNAILDLSRIFTVSASVQLALSGGGILPGANRGAGGYSDFLFNRNRGMFQGPNTVYGIQGLTVNTTTNIVDLATSHYFKLSRNTPVNLDLTFFVNASPGQRFILEFVDNRITLLNSVFHLRAGVDKLMNVGDIVEFVVRSDGTFKEIGY